MMSLHFFLCYSCLQLNILHSTEQLIISLLRPPGSSSLGCRLDLCLYYMCLKENAPPLHF